MLYHRFWLQVPCHQTTSLWFMFSNTVKKHMPFCKRHWVTRPEKHTRAPPHEKPEPLLFLTYLRFLSARNLPWLGSLFYYVKNFHLIKQFIKIYTRYRVFFHRLVYLLIFTINSLIIYNCPVIVCSSCSNSDNQTVQFSRNFLRRPLHIIQRNITCNKKDHKKL